MKYLILISMLFANHAIAKRGNYQAISEYCEQGARIFRVLKKCVAQGKGNCIDVSRKKCDYDEINDVEIDDMSKPKYAAKKQSSLCANKDVCIAFMRQTVEVAHPQAGELMPKAEPTDPDLFYPETVEQNYCTTYGLVPFINNSYTEIYCTKQTGYHKKMVKKLVENAQKKADYLALKAAQKADRDALKAEIAQGKANWDTLNDKQKIELLKKMLDR